MAHLPRTFGRLGRWLVPLLALQVRVLHGKARAVVFTFPTHHGLAKWFGGTPSYYYASDDYACDYGFDPARVVGWERDLVRSVKRVFVVSNALGDLLSARHQVPREKFTTVPNGMPASLIPLAAPEHPATAPAPIPAHFRPLVGVLGTINKRLRLDWVLKAVEALPSLCWAFVGPVGEMDDTTAAAMAVLQDHPRCCFTGVQPYDRLFEFAASFDVAVIPLGPDSINATCSPVRFFTQLPFGQPILATAGCKQLEEAEFSSVAHICPTPEDLIQGLARIEKAGFRDGLAERRRQIASENTWQRRAQTILHHIGS